MPCCVLRYRSHSGGFACRASAEPSHFGVSAICTAPCPAAAPTATCSSDGSAGTARTIDAAAANSSTAFDHPSRSCTVAHSGNARNSLVVAPPPAQPPPTQTPKPRRWPAGAALLRSGAERVCAAARTVDNCALWRRSRARCRQRAAQRRCAALASKA